MLDQPDTFMGRAIEDRGHARLHPAFGLTETGQTGGGDPFYHGCSLKRLRPRGKGLGNRRCLFALGQYLLQHLRIGLRTLRAGQQVFALEHHRGHT